MVPALPVQVAAGRGSRPCHSSGSSGLAHAHVGSTSSAVVPVLQPSLRRRRDGGSRQEVCGDPRLVLPPAPLWMTALDGRGEPLDFTRFLGKSLLISKQNLAQIALKDRADLNTLRHGTGPAATPCPTQGGLALPVPSQVLGHRLCLWDWVPRLLVSLYLRHLACAPPLPL